MLSAAVIASLAIGDDVPENRTWLDSLLQTYTWIIAHDIGPAGTNLESGLPAERSKNLDSHFRFVLPNAAMATESSAPQSTAQIAIVTTFTNG